ncbi:MAG: hypothetical protein J6T86_01250 [Bacteroidales bacterium]|nr:hypothetical protein [Bacteroidales bacterium]
MIKQIVCIGVLLVSIFWGGRPAHMSSPSRERDAAIQQPLSENLTLDNLPNKDMVLNFPVQVLSAGTGGNAQSNVRNQQSSSQSFSFFKHSNRGCNADKAIQNYLKPSQKHDIYSASSLFSAERKLTIICLLRI